VTAKAASRAPAGETGFQLLVEHLPDLVLLAFDADLRIWAATGGALRARGWTAGHFVGRRVPDVGRPADVAVTEAHCRAALRGRCRRLVTTGKTDPSRLWTDNLVPLPDERGAVIGGMVIARDVTDHRRAERQLLASRRQLAEAIHPQDTQRVMACLGRIRDDPSPFELEHRIIRVDGHVRTVLARGEGVVDEDGRVVRFIGTDQDITERRRAEAERRRLLARVYEAQEGQDRRLAADLAPGKGTVVEARLPLTDPTEGWGA
jgi:PAS domain-containing protein